MIKKIEKPSVNFTFPIFNHDKFFYDDSSKEYFFKTRYESLIYFNLNGEVHRKNKPAIIYLDGAYRYYNNNKLHRIDGYATYDKFYFYFYINGDLYNSKLFAENTDHLICDNCKTFCKQVCFF